MTTERFLWGILQWHGDRALRLLRRILTEYPSAAACLSAALANEIRNPNTVWSRRTLSVSEKREISGLLTSAAGQAVQDAVAWEDMSAYVEEARSLGMRTDATVFYYASICNQFGYGGGRTYLQRIRQTMGVGEEACFYDLQALHEAVHQTNYGRPYLGLRDKTYQAVLNLGWSLTGEPEPDPDRGYEDLPPAGTWSRPGIDYVLDRGLFRGVSETVFDPEGSMTRAMLVTVLYRAAGEPAVSAESPFSDVPPTAWYGPAAAWGAETGIVRGVSADSFAPDRPITRAELVTLLYRFAGVSEAVPAPTEDLPACLAGFSDAGDLPVFARPAMAWAVDRGLILGAPGPEGFRLLPEAVASRAQVAALLQRCLPAA